MKTNYYATYFFNFMYLLFPGGSFKEKLERTEIYRAKKTQIIKILTMLI